MRQSPEKLSRSIQEKIEKFSEIDKWLPGIKVIQRIDPEENLFICQRGKQRYQLSEAFFRHLSKEDFRNTIFDPLNSNTCLIGTFGDGAPKRNLYIRYNSKQSPQEAELVYVELIEEDSPGLPVLRLIQILPSHLMGWVPAKTARIVNEMCFQSDHRRKYQLLTKRNREVLGLMVKGISAEEIGERLFIGVNTVNTHKRRVREILEIRSNYELLQYGLAFDLI